MNSRPHLQQKMADAKKAIVNIQNKYNYNQHKTKCVSSKYSLPRTEPSLPPNNHNANNNNVDDYECIEDEDSENDGTSRHPTSTLLTSINSNKNRKKGIVYCIEWCYKCIIHTNLTIFLRICWLSIRFGSSMVHNT